MTWTFALGMLVAPLTFAGGALRRRRHTLAEADVRGTRNRLALRALKASLKQELTIEVVGEAMEQYLMAKLGWERSQLTRDAVRTHLQGQDPALGVSWDDIWVACEMQRLYCRGISPFHIATGGGRAAFAGLPCTCQRRRKIHG